ncbi:hypothetical protein ACFX2J_009763 [Malus domestica]|uniref:Uncharacterized protein n=1 Tax=Malus domestica TaxID=3750 RepID=A0A498IKE9_MALDO|nr:hypothetical protein DVH24_036104 [Malus domestica]
MKLIWDAKFGRKIAPEMQQNGQSTDGAVSNRSSSREENSARVLCAVPVDEEAMQRHFYFHMPSGNSSARVLCGVPVDEEAMQSTI